MKKNILLLTSLYPCDEIQILNNTAVCHYFATEWQKMGYNVRVIFNYNVYPRFYYLILRLFRKQMANVFGVSIQDIYVSKHIQYNKEGINVDLIPIYKKRPGGRVSKSTIAIQEEKIKTILQKTGFRPDFILGHFRHPNLELVVKLKEYYHAKGTIALHGAVTKYSKADSLLFNRVDAIGYRSYPTKLAFESWYGKKPFFMCPSGVPEQYITKPRTFQKPISKYIYVGTFMRRKYPSCLVPAIANVYKDDFFNITYIGNGSDKNCIIKKAKNAKCLNRITFTGRIPREEIFQYLDQSEVFIMISKTETFGLVYLEAMARGCIVVASRNEGMDGIIENGRNGFLCEAGNEDELEQIVLCIKNMTLNQLNKISQESIETAKRYTDYNVAKNYIEAIDTNQ